MKCDSKTFRALAIVASIVGWAASGSRASASPVQFGSNYYEFVLADSISWADANAAAAARVFGGVNGHLATVTSAAENNFLATGVADFSAYTNLLAIVWLGGYVNSSNIGSWMVGPEAGQQFSNGQTPLNGMYTNWGGIEPNNAPSGLEMQVGTLNWFGITQGKWADARNGLSAPCPGICDPIVGYFVEFETPLPGAFPLFASGLGVMAFLIRRRKQKLAVSA
jgi:hypothetical protein